VDLLGTTYSASTLATGYGAHIAQPLLRRAVEGNEDTLTEEEARKIIEKSMQVLFYRDARSLDQVCILFSVLAFDLRVWFSTKLLPLPPRVCTSPSRVSWRRLGHLRRA
jgi:20S proteasome subunit beta 7